MVERLETAGLGFYVRETETKQKLGKYVCYHASVHGALHSRYVEVCSCAR